MIQRDVVGVVRAAEVRAGVAEPAEHRDRARGALEAGPEPAVLAPRLLAHDLEERRGHPAPGRLAARHPLGGARAEDVHVAEHRRPEAALVEVALELAELLRVPSHLRDRAVGAGGDLLLELQVLPDAVALHVLERRHGDRDVEGPAGPAQLVDQPDQVDRVEVEDRRLGRGPARPRPRPVAGEREDVLDAERLEVLQRLPEARAVLADARDVDVGREPPRPRGGAHPHRVVAHRAAGVARDAAGDDVGHPRQPRGHLEELRLALEPGGDQLDHVAEAAGAERLGQRVRRPGRRRCGAHQDPSLSDGLRPVAAGVDRTASRRRSVCGRRPSVMGRPAWGLEATADAARISRRAPPARAACPPPSR